VKASRYLTHIRRLRDPAEPLARLLKRADELERTLGPLLFQLPPNASVDVDRLDGLLRALPREIRPAFEFRHDSWFRSDVYGLLDRAGAALVWGDRPGWRATLPVTGGWAYVRFHRGQRSAPGYRADKLRTWADRLQEIDGDAYAYFNNDQGGAAVHDAASVVRSLLRDGAPVVAAEGVGV
jgi:uncharacterized protein YecE (DUF72 family)